MPTIKPPTCCSCVSEPDVSELGAFDPRDLPWTALSMASEALRIPRLVDLVISPSQCSELWQREARQYSQPPQRRSCSRLPYGMAVRTRTPLRSGRDLFARAPSGHTTAPAITDRSSHGLIAASKLGGGIVAAQSSTLEGVLSSFGARPLGLGRCLIRVQFERSTRYRGSFNPNCGLLAVTTASSKKRYRAMRGTANRDNSSCRATAKAPPTGRWENSRISY
jgi:hypothetical protein